MHMHIYAHMVGKLGVKKSIKNLHFSPILLATIHTTLGKPATIMLEILPIILSEFPKSFAHYSFVHYLLFS